MQLVLSAAERRRQAASNTRPTPPLREARRFPDRRDLFITADGMTASARTSTDCGTVKTRALAVLTLITSSNFVGYATGKSAGLAQTPPVRWRHM